MRVVIDRRERQTSACELVMWRTLIRCWAKEVSTFNPGPDQYDVRVRAMGEFRASAEGFEAMLVASQKLGW